MGVFKKDSAKFGILKDVQILIVDNDIDSRDLYTILFQEFGATVTTTGSIAQALDILYWFLPDILISEINFKGERVDPLMQRLKYLGIAYGKPIPILVTSTCPKTNLGQYLKVGIEAYLLKPIYPDDLVFNIWNLILLKKIAHSSSIKDGNVNQNIGKNSGIN